MTTFASLARQIAELGQEFHARGWGTATSGNYSALVSRQPFRLAITASGVDKATLTEAHVLEIDETMGVVGRFRSREQVVKPSDESLLHVCLVRDRGAAAVLHTHSIWGTVLSLGGEEGIAIEGQEMLKALSGVTSHEYREWLPILENDQDMRSLSRRASEALAASPGSHGFLVRGHGLYTWGESLAGAKQHVEALEFLLEVEGRSRSLRG